MAEHGHPLWDRSPGGFGPIDPANLNVSPELRRRLTAWNDVYECRLDGPVDQVDVESWQREGLSLAHELQHELGAEVRVLYVDARTGRAAAVADHQHWS